MTNELSKQEYLKRYLENEKDSDRKRKKKSVKPKKNVSRLKIVVQDIDLKSINFAGEDDDDDGDEAPVVAEVIDDRPMEEKLKELYESSRWKKLEEISQSRSGAPSENRNIKSNHDSPKSNFSPEMENVAETMISSKARYDSDDDISPSRNQLRSPNRGGDFYSDISSSRSNKQKRNSHRHDSDSDISPPRHKLLNTSKSKLNVSKRHDSDSDTSPPRHKSLNTSNSNLNKSKRYSSNSDISSSQHKALNTSNSKLSKSKKHSSDSDMSPPRHILNKQVRHDSDSDISPHRQQISSELVPQLKKRDKRYDSGSDISPPRSQTKNKSKSRVKNSSNRHDSDTEEMRDHKCSPIKSKSSRSRSQRDSDSDISPPRPSSELTAIHDKNKRLDKTLSGLKAGLQKSKVLQQEIQELRKREKYQLSMLSDEISGKNATTIMRDRKTGLKRDFHKEQEDKVEESKKTKEYEEKYNKWGKGVEQTQDKMEKFQDDMYEMSKPLARYKDDKDLDARLKAVIHDDDPMADYIRKKKGKSDPKVPVYSGPPAPPNRFGIMAGYRWDGVDRSNGFEKKYFEKINTTKAVQDEAYMWSIQDM